MLVIKHHLYGFYLSRKKASSLCVLFKLGTYLTYRVVNKAMWVERKRDSEDLIIFFL